MKPGVLLVIVVTFMLAFVTRAVGTVESVRSEMAKGDDRAEERDFTNADDTTENDENFVSLASMIKSRAAEIETRIAELDERELVLKAVEARVAEKLAELEVAQASLAATAERLDAASTDDIKALASMYANMKPAQAGKIFDAMEPSFAAGFLTEIRPENAAAILASMEPQKAYAVSVIIAGRNAEN